MNSYHVPVLLEQSVDLLITDTNGIYVDVTFGGGSHSKLILQKLSKQGKLIVFDQDPDAFNNMLDDDRVIAVDSNFRYLANYLDFLKIESVSGILADLGVSSNQLDEAEKGFSYRFESDLDMRMNPEIPLSAADVLNQYEELELVEVFSAYGEVRNAKTLARKIVAQRNQSFDWSSTSFNHLLSSIKMGNEYKYFSQVYQALRIEVNDEMKALEDLLIGSLDYLSAGSRFSVLSYHSIEDRIVKNFFKSGNVEGEIQKDDYGNIHRPFKLINKQVITADQNEIERNNRARSAKLRVAEKK